MMDAKRMLARKGVHGFRFNTIIVKEKSSRADGLYSEMKNHDAGTIVMGRHGLSNVEEFSIGRVTRKILHMAADSAVWVI